jgi:glutamate synthase domain-containing protein 3
LKDWRENSRKFIKVMPTDYKRALEILAKEAEEAKID